MSLFRAILTYHSLDDSGSVISTPAATFRMQMRSLFERGIPSLSLPQLLAGVGPDPRHPAVALTFDDGFANFYTQAFPVLADYHLEATVFLVAGMCGGSAQWRGQPQALRSSELLDWSKIAELQRAGIRFGAHTLTHPRLTSIGFEDACREISDSKKRIEDRTGEPVAAFAYPYGAESQRLQSYVRENFEVGCSTRLGYLNARSKPESLERIDVHYLRDLFWFRRLFRRSTGAYLASRGLMRSWKHSLLGPS